MPTCEYKLAHLIRYEHQQVNKNRERITTRAERATDETNNERRSIDRLINNEYYGVYTWVHVSLHWHTTERMRSDFGNVVPVKCMLKTSRLRHTRISLNNSFKSNVHWSLNSSQLMSSCKQLHTTPPLPSRNIESDLLSVECCWKLSLFTYCSNSILTLLIIPPLSTTPSAPIRTKSTFSIM